VIGLLLGLFKITEKMNAKALGETIEAARQDQEPAVVVVDVTVNTPGDMVEDAGIALKNLVEHSGSAVVGIIIFSNTTSVHYLAIDPNRQLQFVVEGVTKDEADTYFDKRQVLVDDDGRALRRRIFEDDTAVIGALKRYADVYNNTAGDATTKLAAAQEIFDGQAGQADSDVEKLLTKGDTNGRFRVVVEKLLKFENYSTDAGVPDLGLGLDTPRKVAAVLQEYPALRYNPTTRRYYFKEHRHRLAAKRFFANQPEQHPSPAPVPPWWLWHHW
jgi:hypothetical protein